MLSTQVIMQGSLLLLSALSFVGAHPKPEGQLLPRTLSNPAQQSGYSTFDMLDVPGPPRSFVALSSVPSICAQYTGPGQECAAQMQAFNVTLGDCGSAWTVCRCTTANITLEEGIDHLARVPIGLRRNVGTVMLMPDSSAHAYTLASDIHYFGVCSQRTWIHESTHASDHGHSSSDAWISAVDGDSCVPDTYAQINYVEDFAQVSVLQVYLQLHGQLPPGFTSDCMPKQFAYMQSLSLYNNATLFGDTCAFNDDWTSSALHTVAPPSIVTDTVITGSYTTVTGTSSVTALSGVIAAAATELLSSQSAGATSTAGATTTQGTVGGNGVSGTAVVPSDGTNTATLPSASTNGAMMTGTPSLASLLSCVAILSIALC
ncbi:hypothetical protein PUNSTDRAFT_131480 [Punctularia strigosozonata HHB-11173 SS5]|uniref:uncharacterized protein n=1 Tax=Punctularia strigosozonata (strain HHB-11173) TaxID=741275 RepID=UPI00044175F1|nr:uncharacterized protein PUNSTDRAFT_131480 [Punctularia strigosozonata HHB-11173 SS5]EIN11314.1 hypothetical protein PUNSTDRAFT_131480 [Punctularia strigosozonata HHB-11173 SS5]